MEGGQGFPGAASGKEPTHQCWRRNKHGFNPWVGKISWRRAWQPTPVILAWRIPWIEEPGRLQSTGSQRVRHNWSDLACMHRRGEERRGGGKGQKGSRGEWGVGRGSGAIISSGAYTQQLLRWASRGAKRVRWDCPFLSGSLPEDLIGIAWCRAETVLSVCLTENGDFLQNLSKAQQAWEIWTLQTET